MIKLIWQMDRHTDWSRDWIEYIFRKVPHETVEDHKQLLQEPLSIIVYNSTVNNLEYLKKLNQNNKRYILVHLSDEWLLDSIDPYQHAELVLRTYYKNCGEKVWNFSTGYMKDFITNLPDKTISQREYVWSFFGHIEGKPTRKHMADAMLKVPNGVYCYIPSNISFVATSMEMAEWYNKSIFVPCSRGNMSFDTLRANEALESGALPIVERSDYWENLYGQDHPLIMIDDWNKAPTLISELLSDTSSLEKRRYETVIWWKNYKEELANRISKKVLELVSKV